MRLSIEHKNTIRREVTKAFNDSTKVFLFGSRSDDSKRGGDIDLYLETDIKDNIFNRKIDFLLALNRELGEQKIDVVINDHRYDKSIYKIARQTGVEL